MLASANRDSKAEFGSYICFMGKPTLGDQATDEDWNFHINDLKTWEAVRPVRTSHSACGDIYEFRRSRGVGYADTVSDAGWKLYAERNELAGSALTDASQLKGEVSVLV